LLDNITIVGSLVPTLLHYVAMATSTSYHAWRVFLKYNLL